MYETFLPLQDLTSKRGSKFISRTEPLFPGYIFVSIELENASWHKINSTRGVSRLISQDGVPRKVPTEVVSGLMSRCDGVGKLLPPTALKRGDSVEILSGALANFIAKVDSIDSQRRIWILMDIMGQLTKVQVEADQINLLN